MIWRGYGMKIWLGSDHISRLEVLVATTQYNTLFFSIRVTLAFRRKSTFLSLNVSMAAAWRNWSNMLRMVGVPSISTTRTYGWRRKHRQSDTRAGSSEIVRKNNHHQSIELKDIINNSQLTILLVTEEGIRGGNNNNNNNNNKFLTSG